MRKNQRNLSAGGHAETIYAVGNRTPLSFAICNLLQPLSSYPHLQKDEMGNAIRKEAFRSIGISLTIKPACSCYLYTYTTPCLLNDLSHWR